MNQHTKGPWHIQYYPHCTAIYAGEKVVGYIDHFNEYDKKLVTAAPELLKQRDELLEALQYWLPKEIPFQHQTSDAVCRAHNEQWNVARAAIAKVIGDDA